MFFELAGRGRPARAREPALLGPAGEQAGCGARVGGFGVVEDLPAGEKGAQFSGFQSETAGQVDGRGYRPSGADSFADVREEIALQVVEVTDQIVGIGFDDEFVFFEIGDAGLDCEPGFGCGVQSPDVVRADVHRGYLPAQAREVKSVPAGSTGEIEGTPGREESGDFDQEW